MARKKVSIIGAGNVGATATYYIAEKVIADMVMVDVAGGRDAGQGARLPPRRPAARLRHADRGTERLRGDRRQRRRRDHGRPAAQAGHGPDGPPEGQRRDRQEAAKKIAEYAPNATVIVVSNPLDVMCHVALRTTGFAIRRVVGMAGILDSTRFRYFVAEELGCALADVHAMVLGGHGDEMVPLPALHHRGRRPDHRAAGRRRPSSGWSTGPARAARRSSAT